MSGSIPNNNAPFQRSQSADFAIHQHQPNQRNVLIAHSSGTLPSATSPVSFQRRTLESAIQLRDSFNSAIRQIEPLVENALSVRQNAMTLSDLLSRPSSSERTVNDSAPGQEASPSARSDYIAINLEGGFPLESHLATSRSPPNNNEEPAQHQDAASGPNEQPPNDASVQNFAGRNNANPADVQQAYQVLLKYLPFGLILIAKTLYDFHEGIVIFMILLVTFLHANYTVPHEAIKRARRSISTLSLELCYIVVCLFCVHYLFQDKVDNFKMVLSLALVRTFSRPLTVSNLLWIVTVTDFTIKLITVMIKIVLTMLPGRAVDFKKRGKIYLFIEAMSQLYRSIATVQPWLYYFLESYQGAEKIVAVFLSAFYMVSKGSDLMFKGVFLKGALTKLLQSVALGAKPSKDQIQSAGDQCPICHDNYHSPVVLECRHIFCENCVSTWFDREPTCPLCRAKIVDDPAYKDGTTSYFIQLF